MTFGAVPDSDLTFPKGYGYGARIAGKWFRLAPNREASLRAVTQQSQADRNNEPLAPYENVLEVGYTFARADLTGGEGLDYYPRTSPRRANELDPIRFFDSSNLDLRRPSGAGEQFAVRLSRPAAQWFNPTGTAQSVVASATNIYVADGADIKRFSDLSDTTPDSTQAMGSAITSLAVDRADNGIMELADGSTYYKPEGTATWTVLTGTALDDVAGYWMVKSRILAYKLDSTDTAAATVLGEVTFPITGTPASPTFGTVTFTTIDTFSALPLSIVDASTAVLVATNDGYVRSYVPQTDTAGDAPILTVRGLSEMPGGEVPYALGHSFGKLIILTYEGLETDGDIRCYSGSLLDERFDYIVGDLQLLREWAAAEEAPDLLDRVSVDRDYMWWIIREAGGAAHLWRYDTVTGGVFRHSEVEADADTVSLCRFQNTLLWLGTGTDVRTIDTTVFHESGWLILPNVNFNLDTEINWVESVIHAIDIADGAGTQIELLASDDPSAILDWQHDSWRLIARVNNQSTEGLTTPLSGLRSRTLALQIRMYPTTVNTETPGLTRVSVRAMPTHRDFVLEIPINVSDYIEAPLHRPLRIPSWGDVVYGTVLDLDGEYVEVEVIDPPLTFVGTVDQVIAPVEYIADRGSSARMSLIRLVGKRTSKGGVTFAVGDGGLGLGLLGVDLLGIDA